MRDLRLVGLSEDRQHLLLRSDAGEQFRVVADDRLRAALRGDRARLGQLEISMDTALRPRDIQARIRAGETPEAVAAAARMPLERVAGYAVPVLAEREHICERARRATIRRRHSSGPTRLLGDVVDEELGRRGTDPRAAAWDSYRREDGRWAVHVTAPGESPATYLFDPPGRYVLAADECGRSLIGDVPPAADPTEMAIASAVAESQLSAPLREGPTYPAPEPEAHEEPSDETAVTPIGSARSLRPAADQEPAPEPEPIQQPRAVGGDELDALARATSDPPGPEPSGRGHGRRRERRRTSVPSWDEIMLGGRPPKAD